MTISEDVGSVATLWRFPVKSMGGEQLRDVEVTERGVLGDRAYALIDKDTGKVVSAKSANSSPACSTAKQHSSSRHAGAAIYHLCKFCCRTAQP